ncbi:MAG: dual specificity protein phosphatase family protein [bacterium]|nr:dual specificity protein phosphatase family protein [bacterium]
MRPAAEAAPAAAPTDRPPRSGSVHVGRRDAHYDAAGNVMRHCHGTYDCVWESPRGARIYLGGWLVAKDCELLQQLGVTRVLNCTTQIDPEDFLVVGPAVRFRWHRFRISASSGINARTGQGCADHFRDAFDFVGRGLVANENVFIHCRAGAHRAGATAAALLMWLENLPVQDAVARVREKRSVVAVTGDLLDLLTALEYHRGGSPDALPRPPTWHEAAPAAAPIQLHARPKWHEPPQPQPKAKLLARVPLEAAPAAAATACGGGPSPVPPRGPRTPPLAPPPLPRSAEVIPPMPRRPPPLPEAAEEGFGAQAAPAAPSSLGAEAAPAAESSEPSDDELEWPPAWGTPAAATAMPEEEPAAVSDSETEGPTPLQRKGAKIALCSWNPGAGARNLIPVCAASGYHVVCLQEARHEKLKDWPDTWATSLEGQQFLAARRPAKVTKLSSAEPERGCRYQLATISWEPNRAGIKALTILGVHLSNTIAKKPDKGPETILGTVRLAMEVAHVDLLTGDINMARTALNKSVHQAAPAAARHSIPPTRPPDREAALAAAVPCLLLAEVGRSPGPRAAAASRRSSRTRCSPRGTKKFRMAWRTWASKSFATARATAASGPLTRASSQRTASAAPVGLAET